MTEFERFCEGRGLKVNSIQGKNSFIPEQFRGMYPWSVQLTYKNRRLTTKYYTANDIEPTSGDVLYSLINDAHSYDCNPTLPEFCISLGFHSNMTNAVQAFEACKSMSGKIRRFLGDEFGTFAFQSNRH